MIGPFNDSRAPYEDPLRLLPRLLSKLHTLWLRTSYPFASVGSDLFAHYTVMMNRSMAPRIRLGNSVMLDKDVWLNIIPEATDQVNIVIGDRCRLDARTWISVKNRIELESDVRIGPSALIMDHGHAYENPDLPIKKQPATHGGTIRIERGCRIGQGVAIVCTSSELILGHNSVVTPNAVVVRSQPPYSVISGNPARVVQQFDPTHSSLGCTPGLGNLVKTELEHEPR